MTKLRTRQLCFFFACMVPVGKLISLPALLAREVGGDLLLSASVNMLMQLFVIYWILWLAERSDLTFYERLRLTFGKTVAKIVVALFGAYFLFSTLVPLLEQKAFVQSAFYDTVPALLVFMPFFLFSGFACTKRLEGIGRCADVSMPLFALSFLGLAVLSVGSGDFTALLPIGDAPVFSILKGSASTLNWFSDSAYLLFFLGRFQGDRRTTAKVTLSYAVGAFVVLFFLAVFYGVFGATAARQTFALLKIARYNKALSTLGRIDYLFSYTMTIVLLFYSVIPLQMTVECLREAFGGRRLPYAILVNVAAAILLLCFNYATLALFRWVQKLFFVFLIFADLLPVATVFLRRNAREKE